MTRLKKGERVGGVGVITFHSRGTRGDYGYGQMQSWEILQGDVGVGLCFWDSHLIAFPSWLPGSGLLAQSDILHGCLQ